MDRTPAQQRLWQGLLRPDEPRPTDDPALAATVRTRLEELTRPVAALRPPGMKGLRLSKSGLDALDCDGRYLDSLEQSFVWSAPLVRGQLVHRAIELDQRSGRRLAVPDLVQHAWLELAGKPDARGGFLDGLGDVEAVALRADATEQLLEFRECFPVLPSTWTVRVEPSFTVSLHGGALQLRGRPDLMLGRVDGRRRIVLVDFKTGGRHRRHGADLRFYSLLVACKYATVPLRVATYYLEEADWETEDVDDATLEAAVRTVAEKASRAARLRWQPPGDRNLRLVPGRACSWCSRAPGCPANEAAPLPIPLRARAVA